MSKRYIDADALRATMYHQAFETDTPLQKWDSGCWIRYKMFEDAIEAAPTIEATPIVRGKWVTAVEYARNEARMCLESKNCDGCPIDRPAAMMTDHSCIKFKRDYPERAVELVAEWAAAHEKLKSGYSAVHQAHTDCDVGFPKIFSGAE